MPTVALEPPTTWEPLDTALRSLATYDWLIVTSANTARVLGERLELHGLTPNSQPRTVAVGPATARALEQVGLRVDLVPEPAVAESLVNAIRGKVRGQRVLLARAAVARNLIPDALTQAGAEVTVVEAYRTVLAQDSQALLLAAFGSAEVKVDALTFTSSSTVTNLVTLLETAGLAWPQARIFSIGPITSETLRAAGVTPDGEAAHHDVDGLVEAVVRGLAPAVSP